MSTYHLVFGVHVENTDEKIIDKLANLSEQIEDNNSYEPYIVKPYIGINNSEMIFIQLKALNIDIVGIDFPTPNEIKNFKSLLKQINYRKSINSYIVKNFY